MNASSGVSSTPKFPKTGSERKPISKASKTVEKAIIPSYLVPATKVRPRRSCRDRSNTPEKFLVKPPKLAVERATPKGKRSKRKSFKVHKANQSAKEMPNSESNR